VQVFVSGVSAKFVVNPEPANRPTVPVAVSDNLPPDKLAPSAEKCGSVPSETPPVVGIIAQHLTAW